MRAYIYSRPAPAPPLTRAVSRAEQHSPATPVMQHALNDALCQENTGDCTVGQAKPHDRITRFATGPSQFNNLHSPVSVLDGRSRSSSVGQWTRPPQTVHCHAYTPLQRPRRSDNGSARMTRQLALTQLDSCERSRLNTFSHPNPNSSYPWQRTTPVTVNPPGSLTSPTSPTSDRRCAPMQTLTNSVLQTGPMQVFMFKQTNVTVLTRPPAVQPPNVNAPVKKASFKKTADPSAPSSTPTPNNSYQSPEKNAVANTNTQAALRRLPSDGAGGLSAVVQNLLRRISPSAANRKARQRRQTTAIVLPCRDIPPDKASPAPAHRPFSLNSQLSTNTDYCSSSPLAPLPSPSNPLNNGLNTLDCLAQHPIPTNMNTAPCTRRLVKTNFAYSASLDDSDAKVLTNLDAAKVRDARVMSFTTTGPHGSKPTMSILERFLKGRTVPANNGDVQRPPNAAGWKSNASSIEANSNVCQPLDRLSATSTPKSRGMYSSSRSSRGVLSSAATPSCTNSVTSDRLSSEVSSGAIADVEESAADEGDIFGAASPGPPGAPNAGTLHCVPLYAAGSRRTTRLPHQLSTCADTSDVPVASECSSESEKEKERKLLANRYRSPRHRGTPSEPLPELNEREPRTALTSPETVKSIKLSLAAFGYGQQPYCAHRTLKSLNDLRSPTLSPLRSPSNSVTTQSQSPAKCNRLAIAILRNNSKHDSLRKPLCSSSKSAGKLKIRRTSSA